MKTFVVRSLLFFFVVVCSVGVLSADIWAKLGRKPAIEAEPNKVYPVDETNGPWMILVTTFSGPQSKDHANQLVFDLRKNHKLRAYTYERTFVHDLNAEQKQHSQHPYAPRFNYKKKGAFPECAVVVGDFQSVDDLDLQKALDRVKQCQPESLYRIRGQLPPKNPPKGSAGPLRMAFAVTNPILPPDFFVQKGGVDKFIESINITRPYSLLTCPRAYTVQVATFTGRSEMKPDEVRKILDGRKKFVENGKMSELEMGEIAATRLCKALRKAGFEAYEFHDRYASIVTVGGFDSVGFKMPNGAIELRPEIVQIMNQFQGRPATQGVGPGTISHEPVRFDNIECDVQPRIVQVPKVRR